MNEQIKLLEELNQIVTIVRRIKYNPVGLKISRPSLRMDLSAPILNDIKYLFLEKYAS